MASVSIYLNFSTECEAAFTFYKSVFGGEFAGRGIQRFSEMPPAKGAPPIPEEVKNLVLHVELPIVGGFQLMGSDAPEGFSPQVVTGNHAHINLQLDSRKETKRLFDALSAGGSVTMELREMFWGDYFGRCTDKFGIQWMLNCPAKV